MECKSPCAGSVRLPDLHLRALHSYRYVPGNTHCRQVFQKTRLRYAIAIIPLGVLGARAYVYIFPWAGSVPDWSTYFNFRSGGLGIYGGVIVGYVVAYLLSKCKKQDFRIIVDCILPGVLLAQSIGRWGNFANQEAFGNLITTDYSAMPNFFEGINGGKVHGFNFLVHANYELNVPMTDVTKLPIFSHLVR